MQRCIVRTQLMFMDCLLIAFHKNTAKNVRADNGEITGIQANGQEGTKGKGRGLLLTVHSVPGTALSTLYEFLI